VHQKTEWPIKSTQDVFALERQSDLLFTQRLISIRKKEANMKKVRIVMLSLLILCISLIGIINCGAGSGKEEGGDETGSGDIDSVAEKFAITSSAFSDGGKIPLKYSCRAESNYKKPSLPLSWSGVPAGTKSFVLLFDDLHEVADGWVHWLVIDIPATAKSLAEGAGGKSMPSGAKELKNSWGESGYGGPCPPPPTGKHTYRLQLFAMPDAETSLSFDGRNGRQISEMLKSNALGIATITGTYDRSAK